MLAVDAQLERAAEADGDRACRRRPARRAPGATTSWSPSSMPSAVEDVADGVAEGADLLGLAVDRQGHGLARARRSRTWCRRRPGRPPPRGRSAGAARWLACAGRECVCSLRARFSERRTLRASGASAAARRLHRRHAAACTAAAAAASAALVRSARSRPTGIDPDPGQQATHYAAVRAGLLKPSADCDQRLTPSRPRCRGSRQRVRTSTSAGSPGAAERRVGVGVDRPRTAPSRSSPRTSAIARIVSGTRYDALVRPRCGIGVRYGASVSTSTRSAG